ncbi:MAG TPA: Fic family protein [Candidatus Saccharibacteria bacterium]|nr:Fic family protein [Candidatus Saccharibacteria bacterium]
MSEIAQSQIDRIQADSMPESDGRDRAVEAALLRGFSTHKEKVAELKLGIREGEMTSIGGGKHSVVYELSRDGAEYIVRIPKGSGDKSPFDVIEEHVAAGAIAHDLPGHERFVTADYGEGVVISEKVPGAHIDAMRPQDVQAMTDEHIQSLVAHRVEGSKKGVKYDLVMGNLLYDAENGFVDIDYGLGGEEMDEQYAAYTVLFSLDPTERIEQADTTTERERLTELRAAVDARLYAYIDEHFTNDDALAIKRRALLGRAQQAAFARVVVGSSGEAQKTANGNIIHRPKAELTGSNYRQLLAQEFGISSESARERLEQLKGLSHEGIATLLEEINSEVQGSKDSLMEQEKAVQLQDGEGVLTSTIPLEHRHRVFTELVDAIKEAPNTLNPARVADVLALGVVLLHPFKDGNGRTARIIGLTFRDGYATDEFLSDFAQVAEPRDRAREKGGFMMNGYIPSAIAGVDQSDPDKVVKFLRELLTEEHEDAYTGPFGQASLKS